jgi:hypothetical protein
MSRGRQVEAGPRDGAQRTSVSVKRLTVSGKKRKKRKVRDGDLFVVH